MARGTRILITCAAGMAAGIGVDRIVIRWWDRRGYRRWKRDIQQRQAQRQQAS